jgi:2-methylisocitrate lyase-like PEP mutase family enzyme
MSSLSTKELASSFKALHKPGEPVVFANVYDILSARAVAKLSASKALATASYAVAQAYGVEDDDLTLETNLSAVRGIAAVAAEYKKPLTVDLQDGYGDRLEEAISAIIKLGVVGINLEDVDKETHKFYPVETAVSRIQRVLKVAKDQGVPDFVVNARSDVLVHGGKLEEVIERGKRYLEAGATTVFVWGGSKRGVSRQEVQEMVQAFDGRLNVSMRLTPDALNTEQLSEIGVARISVGPALQFKAMDTYAKEAEKVLGSTK